MNFRNQTKEDIRTLFQLVRAAEHKVETLREEMAAEFVKRDDDIVTVRTEALKTRNAFENIEKHLKDVEEYVSTQTDVVAAIILACGLREDGKLEKAYGQIQREREKLHEIAVKDINGKVKEFKFVERTPELTLFPVESCSSFPKDKTSKTPEKAADWVNGVEAAKMLGWQTCSSEKLLRARISFRQAAKNKPLSVNVKSVKDYIARRKPRRRETSGK